MTDKQKTPVIVGQVELVDFPMQNILNVPARIDTGARTSALWASDISIKNNEISFALFGPQSEHYTGERVTLQNFTETVVASSNGVPEARFKVIIPLKIKGRRIKAKFTLTDRSAQVYPVLIGRSTLRGKFIVDVKAGTVLKEREMLRSAELKRLLNEKKDNS